MNEIHLRKNVFSPEKNNYKQDHIMVQNSKVIIEIPESVFPIFKQAVEEGKKQCQNMQ